MLSTTATNALLLRSQVRLVSRTMTSGTVTSEAIKMSSCVRLWPAPPTTETSNVSADDLASMGPTTLAEVPIATAVAVDAAVTNAHRAFTTTWRETPSSERRNLLLELARTIDANATDLATIETRQTGKPLHETRGEVAEVARTMRYFAGIADLAIEPVSLGLAAGRNRSAERVPEPWGVVAAITAFNYPLLLAGWKLGPALAAGNAVVIKAAEPTPLSLLHLATLLPAGLRDVVQVVTGGAGTGRHLVAHPRVGYVSFTGSTAAGTAIARARPLLPMTLELGGKNAMYVDASADLDHAVKVALEGGWANAGQNCCAASRIIVHERVYDAFVTKLAEGLAKRIGIAPRNIWSSGATMGTLVAFAEHAAQIRAQIGKLRGSLNQAYPPSYIDPAHPLATELPDTTPLELLERWIPPVLYTRVPATHAMATAELFGPVVTVLEPVRDVHEAIAVANMGEYGLAAGVLARDESVVREWVRHVRAGMMWVNTWNESPVAVPFGGVGESGRGKELGVQGMNEFLQWKSVISVTE
ncbi:aldehyde dehydrogenase domain-containing protein [Blastocladiella britannica]|nr:aldehyde dehydrogenase domain-containing protein [Blastocladiella britannica]